MDRGGTTPLSIGRASNEFPSDPSFVALWLRVRHPYPAFGIPRWAGTPTKGTGQAGPHYNCRVVRVGRFPSPKIFCHRGRGTGLNAFSALLLVATKIDSIRYRREATELSWRAPANASDKQPYQVEFKSGLSSPWMAVTQPNRFDHNAGGMVWESEASASTTATEAGFYRISIRPIP